MLALSASEGPERLPRNLVDVVMLGIALTCFLLYLATINLPSLFKPPASGDWGDGVVVLAQRRR